MFPSLSAATDNHATQELTASVLAVGGTVSLRRTSQLLTEKLACSVTALARAALSDVRIKFHSAQLRETLYSMKGKLPY